MMRSLPLLAWPAHKQVLTVLAYHRVLPVPDPLRQGVVDANAFEEQIRFFSRNFDVLPLLEAGRLLMRGKLPRRTCCITFDDGYADNLTVAAPILKAHDAPATVFVATAYLHGRRMFNDAVIDTIARCSQAQLDLRELDLGKHQIETLSDRQAAIISILKQFRYRSPEIRENQLPLIYERAECGALPTDSMLNSEQVRELDSQGFEIGGHTVEHPILTSISDDRAETEILAGKQELEAIIGKPILVFAYPNGKPQRDYFARHVDMVRSAGFELAVTTVNGVATPTSDMYQLPRFIPWGTSMTRMSTRMVRNAWSDEIR